MCRFPLMFFILSASLASSSLAQNDKLYTPAVGQKYKPNTGGAVVAADPKNMSAFIAARRKMDSKILFDMLQSGAIERITEGTLLEVVKVDPKSAEHPSGLIECHRIVSGQNQGSVYLGGDILVAGFLTPADEATAKSSALPAPAEPSTAVVRTWKAAAGGFEVEAEFVSADDKNVVLKRKSDGKVLTVGLDKLSAEDCKWLDEQASAAANIEPEPDFVFEVEKPDITVTAEKLAADFAANKADAQKKYRGNVRVEGVIHRIRTEQFGNITSTYVELKAGPNRIVDCSMTIAWTKFLAKCKPGMKVAIVGGSVDLKSGDKFVIWMIGANFVKLK